MKFFNLAFIGAFGAPNLQSRHLQTSSQLWATSPSTVVNFNVGGIKYSLFDEDIRKHPGSFFAKMFENQDQKEQEVTVDRDGELFKFVHAFMVTGQLLRNVDGAIPLNPSVLNCIRNEANFYDLPTLRDECNKAAAHRQSARDSINLFTCEKTIENVTPFMYAYAPANYSVDVQIKNSPVFGALRQVIAPLAEAGEICHPQNWQTYVYDDETPNEVFARSSTIDEPRPEELIQMAKYVNRHFCDSNHTFVLDAQVLNTERLEAMGEELELFRMFPQFEVKCRPAKVVIQTAGSNYQFHTRSEAEAARTNAGQYLGTAVVVLMSKFQGGEVTVGTGPDAVSFNVSFRREWFAAHANSSVTVAPVTNGTRVSVVYDIHSTPALRWTQLNECCYLQWWREEEEALSEVQSLVSARSISSEVAADTIQAIDAELQGQDAVLIGLQHLYPDFDRDGPSSLRGGDRALYNLLSEKYDVHVVAATVHYTGGFPYESVTAALYFPPGSPVNPSIGIKSRSKLFLPLQLTKRHVLYPKDRNILYIVSALRLTRKK